ncbi:MAG: hypothetical protein ACNA77_08890 [Opitutales bacterium]
MKLLSPLILLFPLIFTACVSSSPHSEFVKTITFSSLDSFSYKHTIVNGMDFRESEKLFLEEISEAALSGELRARGFEQLAEGSDFFVVTKWRKAVSSYPNHFDHIDGFQDSLNRRNKPNYYFAARLHLIVELYESSTGELFWRKDLPNIFDAVQFTEERVIESLKRAMENFPERVEKDPNLPDIG